MNFDDALLEEAHKRSIRNRPLVEASDLCGCFYCLRTYSPALIKEWVRVEETALCPYCGIDSVIGSKAGYPLTAPFLVAMRRRWFETPGTGPFDHAKNVVLVAAITLAPQPDVCFTFDQLLEEVRALVESEEVAGPDGPGPLREQTLRVLEIADFIEKLPDGTYRLK